MDQPTSKIEKSTRRKSILLAAMGGFLDGYDIMIISVVLLPLIPQWNLSPLEIGLLTSMVFFGVIVGGAVFGTIADRIGRRKVFILDMVLFIAGAIACGLAQNIVQLIIFRFFVGMAVGMDAPTSASIIAEFSSNKHRGRNTTFMAIFWPIGVVIASIVGLVLYSFAGDIDWRLMFISAAIPAIAVVILRATLPETPYWQEMNEKARDKKERNLSQSQPAEKKLKAGSVKDLFSPPWRKSIFFTMAVWFLINAVSGLYLYMPYIAKTSFGLKDESAIAFSALVTFIHVIIAVIVIFWVIDQKGRRPLMMVGASIATIMAVILAFSSGIMMPIFYGLVLMSFQGAGQQPQWVWSVELFPTRLRATAQGLSTSFGKVGSLLATLLVPIYMAQVGWKAVMLTYAGLFLLTAFCGYLGPATKGISLLKVDKLDREGTEGQESFAQKITPSLFKKKKRDYISSTEVQYD
jgi:putative MFS transporter